MSDYQEYVDGVRRRLDNPSCLICGDETDSAVEAIDRYNAEVEGIRLCWTCCELAAVAYVRSHGGVPTEAFSPREPVAYRKAKISKSLSKAVFERDAYRCVTCGGHHDLTCDHIHPESLGGPTTLDNLQAMCRSCNSSKGARIA